MKHEWRKSEKQFYVPAAKPVLVSIPTFNFYTIEGEGNPNDSFFAEYIGVLYSLSYGIKMSPKKGTAPKGYVDYTVYPLEGVWDLNEEGRKAYNGTIDKNKLVFKLMIRQPDFVDSSYAMHMLEQVKQNKPHHLLEQVKFEAITEGDCIQLLHKGSYDSERESFKLMEQYAESIHYKRISMVHREIYLSDARKVAPEKLKTVLRFNVKQA